MILREAYLTRERIAASKACCSPLGSDALNQKFENLPRMYRSSVFSVLNIVQCTNADADAAWRKQRECFTETPFTINSSILAPRSIECHPDSEIPKAISNTSRLVCIVRGNATLYYPIVARWLQRSR
mmetsp:Transcript_12769/g.34329  ORF Transcript_12769/g.34329 Transcript_12769/m.34329 type:complete len:127 (+) Transcript_12769:646-1026(+)